MRNVLTNVLGARDQTEIHIQDRSVVAGELLLLCTDGLHGSMDDESIQKVLAEHATVERTAEALVRAALETGSRDNVTALVAACGN
jgi:serine/threonine protein phosphatase PrpC